MNQKTARTLRRETKRTLGNHLRQFADGERGRIERLEQLATVDGVFVMQADVADRIAHIEAVAADDRNALTPIKGWVDTVDSRVRVFERLSFFERLRWLVTGFLPPGQRDVPVDAPEPEYVGAMVGE